MYAHPGVLGKSAETVERKGVGFGGVPKVAKCEKKGKNG